MTLMHVNDAGLLCYGPLSFGPEGVHFQTKGEWSLLPWTHHRDAVERVDSSYWVIQGFDDGEIRYLDVHTSGDAFAGGRLPKTQYRLVPALTTYLATTPHTRQALANPTRMTVLATAANSFGTPSRHDSGSISGLVCALVARRSVIDAYGKHSCPLIDRRFVQGVPRPLRQSIIEEVLASRPTSRVHRIVVDRAVSFYECKKPWPFAALTEARMDITDPRGVPRVD